MDQDAIGPSEAPGLSNSPGVAIPIGPLQAGQPPAGIRFAIGVQSGPLPPQIVEKINPEHITQILQSQENQLNRQHEAALKQIEYRQKDRESQRESESKRDRGDKTFAGCLVGGTLLFILILTVTLLRYGQSDLVRIVIPSVLSFGAGTLAGIGYQRSRQ